MSSGFVYIVGGGGGGRIQVTTDTNYYVATTGSDITGDGSIGNPWATPQHGANYLMYNITAQFVNITLNVAAGTYDGTLWLGKHQVNSFDDNFGAGVVWRAGTIVIEFASGVVFAPSTSNLNGIINVTNANWQLRGDWSMTFGSSGCNAAFTIFDQAEITVFGSSSAITITDHCPIFVDAEEHGLWFCGEHPVQITFNSTLGNLVLVDGGSTVGFYPQCDVHFDVDPGLTAGPYGSGLVNANFGGGCHVYFRNTWSGVLPAAPNASIISRGNKVVDVNHVTPYSKYTLDNLGSQYNNMLRQSGQVSAGGQPYFPLYLVNGTPSDADYSALSYLAFAAEGPGSGFAIINTLPSPADIWAFITSGNGGTGFEMYNATYDVDGFGANVDHTTTAGYLYVNRDGVFGWTNNANPRYAVGALRTGLSSNADATVLVGNGTSGDFSGTLKVTDIITNDDTFMHRTSTALVNNASTNLATLTNAPFVGDPTKWIGIDDNGVTRYIPTWSA